MARNREDDEDEELDDEEDEQPELRTEALELPDSGLLVQDDVLYRRTPDGTVIGKHALAEIGELRIARALDRFAFVMGTAFGGLSYVAYTLLEDWPFWRWAGVLFFAAVALMFLSTFTKPLLHVRTADGVARYRLQDNLEDCEGFVLTLRSMLRQKPRVEERRAPEPRAK